LTFWRGTAGPFSSGTKGEPGSLWDERSLHGGYLTMHWEKIVRPWAAGEVMQGLKPLEEVMLVEVQTSSRASVPLRAQKNHLSICVQIF
jgi:hypothetical protein